MTWSCERKEKIATPIMMLIEFEGPDIIQKQ